MKKSKIKLVLKKETFKTLNASEASMIRGGEMDSGSIMCGPPPPPLDTKNPGQCVSNSGLKLCPK